MRRKFLAAVAGYALLAGSAAAACKIETVEIPVYMAGTQPRVTVGINGTDVTFVVDTGATFSMIATTAAERLRLPRLRNTDNVRVFGVGGRADAHMTRVDQLTIKNSTFSNVHFIVGGNLPGANAVGLLGQNFLGNADMEYDLANGVMRLHSPNDDCKNAQLAYWAKAQPVSEVELEFERGSYLRQLVSYAFVNGVKTRVLFDTGASLSILSLSAARRAGLTPETPGVVPGLMSTGIGSREIPTWIGPVKSFALGNEQTTDTRLRFGDLSLDVDMLLGADFFLAHRMYFAKSQNKLYFTYNGGPVFNLARAAAAAPDKQGASEPAPPSDTQAAPSSADGYARRAAALAARRDFQGALADFNRACEMDPSVAGYFTQRGQVHLALRQAAAAMTDFTEALRLDPSDAQARIARATLRFSNRDTAGAREDLVALDTAVPTHAAIRFNIARLYLLMNDPASALVQLNQWVAAHEVEVSLHEGLSDRCWARALLGTELDKALADCDAALKARQTAARYDRRGLVHLRKGNLDKAIDDYNEALRLEPKSPWALLGRGMARIGKGDEAGGRADIAAATGINPTVVKDAARYGLKP